MSWNQFLIEVDESLQDAAIGELDDLGAGGVWESGQPQAGEIGRAHV